VHPIHLFVNATKVVRVALENAVSVASTHLLAEATLTERTGKSRSGRQRRSSPDDAWDVPAAHASRFSPISVSDCAKSRSKPPLPELPGL
jgi:hypothetical protein